MTPKRIPKSCYSGVGLIRPQPRPRYRTREAEIIEILERALDQERARQASATTPQEALYARLRQAAYAKVLDLIKAPRALLEWKEARHDLLSPNRVQYWHRNKRYARLADALLAGMRTER